jgi:flavin reductase (DIM6/NTAB) family NADH-FMN oxidoreductase RutF
MNLKVEQMAASLAWSKNKDDKFACTGINFVLIDKL